jgi:glyoxylase-like metal-dependent hydrolase (beta-lactamase superfamily II)
VKVHQFPLPTPFPVGQVNVFLMEEPLTLIDTGPGTADALRVLQGSLKARGFGLSDIERVLVTHGHVDHHGLASQVREASSADIYVGTEDKLLVEDFHGQMERAEKEVAPRLERLGLPKESATRLAQYHKMIRKTGEDVNVDFELRSGDKIPFKAGELRVIEAPGHTAGSVVLADGTGKAFSGDTILEDMVPDAIFSLEDVHSSGLRTYIASLKALKAEHISLAMPGHGEPFPKPERIIDSLLFNYADRKQKVLALLGEWTSAIDISRQVFGDLKLQQVLYAVNETMQQCALLMSEGAIMMKEQNHRIVFKRV